MAERGLLSGIYLFMEWVARFVYLQFLWAVFSVVGLIGFGLFPATFTMFAITRRWIRGNTDFPLFSTFKEMYRSGFLKTNAIGWIMAAIGFILYFYLRQFQSLTGTLSIVLFFLSFILCIIFIMTLFFLAPVYAQYELSVLRSLKIAAMMALSHPLHVISMGFTVYCFILFIQKIPGLLPFFSFSYLVFALMWIANLAFISKEKSPVL